MGVLELTSLPSIDEDRRVPLVRDIDALLVAGGDVLYRCPWMRETGLTDLFPSLSDVNDQALSHTQICSRDSPVNG